MPVSGGQSRFFYFASGDGFLLYLTSLIMDWEKQKKVLVDYWHVTGTNLGAFVAFTTGDETFAFSIPMAGTKTFMLQLQKLVETFEEQNGEIDTSGSQVSIQSPIQPKKP